MPDRVSNLDRRSLQRCAVSGSEWRSASLAADTDCHTSTRAPDSRRRTDSLPIGHWRCHARSNASYLSRINTLANLFLVLSVAGGVPQAHAFAGGDGACDLCSARHAVTLEALSASRLPAEAAASRDSARTDIATAWRSIQLYPGILTAAVVLSALGLSGTLPHASGALSASVSLSSSSGRGPPFAI